MYSAFACSRALTNTATSPSTAAFVEISNCTTETVPENNVQIKLIKLTDAALHLVFKLIIFFKLFTLCYILICIYIFIYFFLIFPFNSMEKFRVCIHKNVSLHPAFSISMVMMYSVVNQKSLPIICGRGNVRHRFRRFNRKVAEVFIRIYCIDV